jgi:hypothetical protein
MIFYNGVIDAPPPIARSPKFGPAGLNAVPPHGTEVATVNVFARGALATRTRRKGGRSVLEENGSAGSAETSIGFPQASPPLLAQKRGPECPRAPKALEPCSSLNLSDSFSII